MMIEEIIVDAGTVAAHHKAEELIFGFKRAVGRFIFMMNDERGRFRFLGRDAFL